MTFDAPTWQEASDAVTRLKNSLAAESLQNTGTLDDRSPGRYRDVVVSFKYIQSAQDMTNQLAASVGSVMNLTSQNQELNTRVMQLQAQVEQLQNQLAQLSTQPYPSPSHRPPQSTTTVPKDKVPLATLGTYDAINILDHKASSHPPSTSTEPPLAPKPLNPLHPIGGGK